MQKLPADEQRDWLTWLRANPDLAGTLVFLIKPGQKPEKIFALLKKLRNARGPLLEKYANLTAAICVDHATPQSPRVGENRAKEASPLEIFDFYVKNEPRMFFGVRDIPAQLLVWVVDTTASIDEMNRAGQICRKPRHRRPVLRYQIRLRPFREGRPRRYTKPGIAFRTSCATAASARTRRISQWRWKIHRCAHRLGGRRFSGLSTRLGRVSSGREKADAEFPFRRTRVPGRTGRNHRPPNPQKHPRQLCLGIGRNHRHPRSTDRLAPPLSMPPSVCSRSKRPEKNSNRLRSRPTPTLPIFGPPREAATADTLALAKLALKESAGYPPAWFVIRDVARRTNSRSMTSVAGRASCKSSAAAKYPDFTLAVLMPMIQTIPDVRDQDAMWNAAFGMFQSRFDLAASIRMEQAAMWQSQGNTVNAGACYMDVIDRYSDAGPFVLDALKHAGKITERTGPAVKGCFALPKMLGEVCSSAGQLLANHRGFQLVSRGQVVRR